METKNFPVDFVKRTKANLELYQGEFGFTNLLNCTLGLIILPYEKGIKAVPSQSVWSTDFSDLPNRPSFQIHRFEPLRRHNGKLESCKKTLKVLLQKIRHGLAHQNVWPVNLNGEFCGVRIKNFLDEGFKERDDPDLHVQFSEQELKDFALFIANEYLKLYAGAQEEGHLRHSRV